MVLSSCFQTSTSSLSSCLLDEAMEALNKPPFVRGPLFLTGNSRVEMDMFSTSSSDDESLKEPEENSSNFELLSANMHSITTYNYLQSEDRR